MQTVILAGGEGTRLRPLTEGTPKPLVKILGESAIERLLKRLRACGIRSAVLCTHFMAEKMEEALGQRKCGVYLKYRREEVPLGTAGCVKAAWNGDDVLVLSGDGVCGFDYRAITEFHRSCGADVTIVARKVSDPREYGLITADGEVITGFIEKPGYDGCVTDLANTGVYVVSKEVMRRIPDGEKTDFAQDVFPKLLSEGKKLCVYVDTTYWYDIGDIPSLIKCQTELLGAEGRDSAIFGSASVGSDSVISAGAVVEDGAAIGSGSRVLASLISEGASVGANADICEAVICKNVTAGEGLIMKRFSALGEGCVIGSDVTVGEGVRVAPRTRLPDGAIVRTDISGGNYSSLTFGDGGEALGLNGLRDIFGFGCAVGAALGADRIALGGPGEGFEAVSLGLRSSGVGVYGLRGASFGETVFCARKLGCTHFIYADGGIYFASSSDLELSRALERKTVQAYSRIPPASVCAANIADGAAVSDLYVRHLKSLIPESPKIRPLIRTESRREAEVFSEVFPKGEGEKVTFAAASDGRTVSALTDNAVISYENLVILCCKSYFEKRKSVVLPPRAPLACEKLAEEYRSSVIRGAAGSSELSMFCCDPLELIAEVTAYVTSRGISLEAAADELPKVIYTRKTFDAPEGLPKIMSEGFEGVKAGSDVMLESGGARAFVRPAKSGRAVSLYIESVSVEAANEISADIAERLKGKKD